jgi:EVE domain
MTSSLPKPTSTPKCAYWIGVVSSDHVGTAVAGGFVQLSHGKAGPLERMREGDAFAFYSPRASYPDGAPVQAFTAIGRVAASPIFQIRMTDDFAPFRRRVRFLAANDAPIKPLLDALSFIRNKAHWGAAFRFGFLRVPAEDFARIAAAMGREAAAEFPAPALALNAAVPAAAL